MSLIGMERNMESETFPYEWLTTKIRFDIEAKGNVRELAIRRGWYYCDKPKTRNPNVLMSDAWKLSTI